MNSWRMIMGAGGALAVWTCVLSAPAQTASPYTMPVAASSSRDANPNGADRVLAPAAGDNQIGEDEITIPLPPPQMNFLTPTPGSEKSWVEMTPEEILGIAPPTKPTDDKLSAASRKNSDRSPLQDLLSEQHSSQQRLLQRLGSVSGSSDDADLPNRLDSTGLRQSETMGAEPVFVSSLGHLLEGARQGFSQESAEADWVSVFHAPAAAPVTAAQQADMEAFKQMLNPQDQPESGSGIKAIATDPDAGPAKINPNGASFAAPEDGISRPKRLEALPVTNPGGIQTPYATPSWAPQPPPWTLKTPQLFVEPQRKF